MFKRALYAVVTAIILACPAFGQDLWSGKDGSLKNIQARDLVIDNQKAYLATRSSIFRTVDITGADKWEEVFSLPAGENEITSVSSAGRTIFLGTKRGLIKSADGAKTWRKVFKTITPEKSDIISMEISRYNPAKIVIVTSGGVFLSEDSGSKWTDLSSNLTHKKVFAAAINRELIYVCGEDGLYMRRTGQEGWKRLYIKSAPENNATAEANAESDESIELSKGIACVTVKGSRVYIGVKGRILYSDDGGKAWQSLTINGLGGIVNNILLSVKTNTIYCATSKGVFKLDNEAQIWSELYKGMDKSLDVSVVRFSGHDENIIWAVTEKGLYKMDPENFVRQGHVDIERNVRVFRIAVDKEPQFRELQQAAIRFNDVSPDKIIDWQRDSRLKALIPKISAGVGNDRSSNTEIYTSATRDYSVVGPEDHSSSIDFSVSWDLGNLIWSDDQTNIDVRSRLNTQLRNDVLDDLRRLYYERKRLQFENMASPPKDARQLFERDLRIQELTQAIDDLTGNYLSDNMKSQ